MTLWRYLLTCFLKSLVAVQTVIAIVVLLAAGVENLRRFSEASAREVAAVTLLQAPEVLYQAFPLVLMLSSLVTFLRLARTSELVVMRAAGVSALRLIAVPGFAALLLATLAVAAVNPIVAATIRRGAEVEDGLRGRDASRLSFSRTDSGCARPVPRPDGDPGGPRQSRRHAAEPGAPAPFRQHRRPLRPDRGGRGRARRPGLDARQGHALGPHPRRALRQDGGRGRPRPAHGADARADPRQLLRPETVPFWELSRFIDQMEAAGFGPKAPPVPPERAG